MLLTSQDLAVVKIGQITDGSIPVVNNSPLALDPLARFQRHAPEHQKRPAVRVYREQAGARTLSSTAFRLLTGAAEGSK
jgi:hypothetical protein